MSEKSGYRVDNVDVIRQKEDIIPNESLQEIAAEQEPRFLNLLLHNRDFMQDVIDSRSILPESFFWEQNARLFSIMAHRFLKYKGSLLTVEHVLSLTQGSPNKASEDLFFKRIYDLRVDKEDFEWLKRGIIDRSIQQKFYEITASHAKNEDGESGVARILKSTSNQTEMISDLIGRLVDLEGDKAIGDESVKVTDLSTSLEIALESIEERRYNPLAHRGRMTGFRGFDDVTNGLYDGDYGVIVGYPNGGKTTMLINLAMGLAANGATVCYVTVESNEQIITERMLSKISHIDSNIIKKGGDGPGKIDRTAWLGIERAKHELDHMYGNRFTFITVPQKTQVNAVLALLEKRRRKIIADQNRTDRLNVAIIDYLDVIDPVERHPDRRDLEIGDVSVRLQAYGRTHKIIMLTAQSFNNEMIKAIKKMQSSNSENQEPDLERVVGLEGIGGTQKLSRDADYVWGLILGQREQKLSVYWMKSRHSPKDAHFSLQAKLECCDLIETGSWIESHVDESLPLDKLFPGPEDGRESIDRSKMVPVLDNAGILEAEADPDKPIARTRLKSLLGK